MVETKLHCKNCSRYLGKALGSAKIDELISFIEHGEGFCDFLTLAFSLGFFVFSDLADIFAAVIPLRL